MEKEVVLIRLGLRRPHVWERKRLKMLVRTVWPSAQTYLRSKTKVLRKRYDVMTFDASLQRSVFELFQSFSNERRRVGVQGKNLGHFKRIRVDGA